MQDQREDVGAHIEKIRALYPDLNRATSEAFQTVKRVEEFLNDECSVGIEAYEGIESHVDDGRDEARSYLNLQYVRVAGRYRIAVEELIDGDDHETVRPWADCPRGVKLKTFCGLPGLLAKIAAAMTEQTTKTVKTVEVVAKAIGDGIEPVSPPPTVGYGPSIPWPKPVNQSEKHRKAREKIARERASQD